MEVIRNIHDNIYFDVKKINIIKEYYISRKEIKGLIAMSCIIVNRKAGEKKKQKLMGLPKSSRLFNIYHIDYPMTAHIALIHFVIDCFSKFT